MAKPTTQAKTAAASAAVVEGPDAAVAAAKAQADAQAQAAAAAAASAPSVQDGEFPLTIKVLNLSGHVFEDNVTGKLIPTGTEETVILNDEAQADAFYQSLHEFAKYLPEDAVQVTTI